MAISASAVTGALSRAAIKIGASTSNVDWGGGTAFAFEFLDESIVKTEQVINSTGIRGTRSRAKEQDRAGTYTIGGTLTIVASPIILETFLPLILGTAKDAAGGAGGTDRYALAETLLTFGLTIDKVGKIFEYPGCLVTAATISGVKDQPITIALEIVGLLQNVEASWHSNIPAIVTTALGNPYMFHDLSTLTLDGQAVVTAANSFTLRIDNFVDVQHRSSTSPTSTVPQDRQITLSVPVPFNSGNYTDLYADADTAGVLAFTDGTYPCTINFAHLAQTRVTPIVAGKTEVGLNLEYEARSSGFVAATVTTHEMYVDLDSTT